MLGYESERRLTNLLVAVGDGERDLEGARQRLCSIRDFAPHSAFERIDRDISGAVTSVELINFLRDNSVYHVAESEAFNLTLSPSLTVMATRCLPSKSSSKSSYHARTTCSETLHSIGLPEELADLNSFQET